MGELSTISVLEALYNIYRQQHIEDFDSSIEDILAIPNNVFKQF